MKQKARLFSIKPSTQKFIHAARSTPNYSIYDFLHGYIYTRWPYLYIGIGTGEHPIAKTYTAIRKKFNRHSKDQNNIKVDTPSNGSGTIADNYHGKVVPLDSAKQLVTVNEDIQLLLPEKVIPYERARDLILKNPNHIVALECPCRASRPDPCLPLDVCLIVGEPFTSFVLEHHSNRARKISSSESVEILKAENERGHVHHAFFKDAMLGRFYAICNCCSCCCGAMQAQRNGTPMLIASGYTSQVNTIICEGCGDCIQYCQFHGRYLGRSGQ